MSGGKCPGGTCPGGFCPVTGSFFLQEQLKLTVNLHLGFILWTFVA